VPEMLDRCDRLQHTASHLCLIGVMQCVAACLQVYWADRDSLSQPVAACCSLLQPVSKCIGQIVNNGCQKLHIGVTACRSLLQPVAASCSWLQAVLAVYRTGGQ